MSVFGIDLGTTYSCIAKIDRNGNPEVIANQTDGTDTLASAVYFETEDNVVIGDAAKEMVETDGDRVVQFVKRYIGKSDAPTYEFFGKTYNPTSISMMILKRLKQIAEEQGEVVEKAVITVPAYFGFEEINATKTAAEKAGIEVLDLVNEPTAAALNYCARDFQEDRTIMVYDLGGGTFDVTIMKMSLAATPDGSDARSVVVLATGGNDRLGGKDWDDRLFEFVLQACCDDNALTPDEIEAETRQQIRSKVEAAKKKLTQSKSANVSVHVNGAMTKVTITREDFEQMTKDKVAETMSYVDKTMADAMKKDPNLNIDTVLLVGGSTFMPMIREAVEAKFPGKVQIHEPNKAVAMGAALLAMIHVLPAPDEMPDPIGDPASAPADGGESNTSSNPMADQFIGFAPIERIVPVDQVRRSFGPGVMDGSGEYVVDNIIKMGENMPVGVAKRYGTVADNMEKIVLRVFENMSLEDMIPPCVDRFGEEQPTDPSHATKLLGQLEMKLPPNTPKGSPIEVTFEIVDQLGIKVMAQNLATGEIVDAYITMAKDESAICDNATEIAISGEAY